MPTLNQWSVDKKFERAGAAAKPITGRWNSSVGPLIKTRSSRTRILGVGRCSYFKGTDPLDPMNLEKHSAVRKAPKDPLGWKRYRLARFAAGSRLRWFFGNFAKWTPKDRCSNLFKRYIVVYSQEYTRQIFEESMCGKSYQMNFTNFRNVDRKYVSQRLWKYKLKSSIVR